MLAAFALGADGILLGESEEKSNPYPHSVSTIKSNISNVKDILEKEKIDGDRVRLVEFVTVMLTGFVENLNGLSDFVGKLGPIPAEELKRLGQDINKKLFG